MLGRLEEADTVLASVPPDESDNSIHLTATRGLAELLRGHLREAERLYREAETKAREQGRPALARTVRQKMHLEMAKALQQAGQVSEAVRHVKSGLSLTGSQAYRGDLQDLQKALLRLSS
jgi:ATP/maltotriose-dependent transcriptional regulator MalT